MNDDRDDVEVMYSKLVDEIGTQPGLAQRVLERARVDSFRPIASSRHRFLAVMGLLSGLAAALAVAFFASLLATPSGLYASILEAVEHVETVHVSGWTSEVVRKWAIEETQTERVAPAKHDVDAWYWNDEGIARSLARQGPITLQGNGRRLQEYQSDTDLLYIFDSKSTDGLGLVSRLAEYLRVLKRPSLQKEQLGQKRQGQATLSGIRLTEGNRIEEFWWDTETRLPVSMKRFRKSDSVVEVVMELSFSVNEPVPNNVRNFQMPTATHVRHVRHGRTLSRADEAWREHVRELAERLSAASPPGRVVLVPREDGRVFSHDYVLTTPNDRHVVVPLGGKPYMPDDVENLIKLTLARWQDAPPPAQWRVPDEFKSLEFRHDLVYEVGVTWEEWMQFALGHHGLKFTTRTEDRNVWIARHDGKTRIPWKRVVPPTPYIVEGGIQKKGLVKLGVGQRLHPVTLRELFDDLVSNQAAELNAKSILIDDQTQLPHPPRYDQSLHGSRKAYRDTVIAPKYLAATDSPYFRGDGATELARTWFRERLGITFTDEVRPIDVHVVSRATQ